MRDWWILSKIWPGVLDGAQEMGRIESHFAIPPLPTCRKEFIISVHKISAKKLGTKGWKTLSLCVSMELYLNLVTRWWIKISISSLAISFPAQAWTPFPNGMKVLGLGAVCIHQQSIPEKSKWIRDRERDRPPELVKLFLAGFSEDFFYFHVANLKSWWVENVRIRKEFWVVMNVPEQRQHLPSLWY